MKAEEARAKALLNRESSDLEDLEDIRGEIEDAVEDGEMEALVFAHQMSQQIKDILIRDGYTITKGISGTYVISWN